MGSKIHIDEETAALWATEYEEGASLMDIQAQENAKGRSTNYRVIRDAIVSQGVAIRSNSDAVRVGNKRRGKW